MSLPMMWSRTTEKTNETARTSTTTGSLEGRSHAMSAEISVDATRSRLAVARDSHAESCIVVGVEPEHGARATACTSSTRAVRLVGSLLLRPSPVKRRNANGALESAAIRSLHHSFNVLQERALTHLTAPLCRAAIAARFGCEPLELPVSACDAHQKGWLSTRGLQDPPTSCVPPRFCRETRDGRRRRSDHPHSP